ncbi:unnamed protein product [Amaranthus hypochondriacus]
MAKKSSCFFQPLIPGFLSNFSIPRSFHKQLQVQDMQDKNEVVLRAKQGKTWEIKVDHQQGYKFKDGWKLFCKYYGLQVGDFLVFKHRDNLVFDVIIFDPTACERKFQRLNTSITNNGIHAPGKKGFKRVADIYKACSESGSNASFKPRGYPYCRIVVKSYTERWGVMDLPSKFCKENDVKENSSGVLMIDERGDTWKLTLKKHGKKIYIGKWRHLHRHNGYEVGDLLVFELISSGELPVMKLYTN